MADAEFVDYDNQPRRGRPPGVHHVGAIPPVSPSLRKWYETRGQNNEVRYNHHLIEKKPTIIHHLRSGNYPSTAVKLAGITWQVFLLWCHRGKEYRERREEGGELTEAEALYADFLTDCELAMAESESKLVETLRGHSDLNYQATIAMLERGPSRERWHRHDVLEQTGPGGGPLKVEGVDTSPERLAAVLDVLRQAGVLPLGLPASAASEVIDAEAEQVHPPQAER